VVAKHDLHATVTTAAANDLRDPIHAEPHHPRSRGSGLRIGNADRRAH
jgi:hypothetical protein